MEGISVKRRCLHGNSWIQDFLDLAIANDDICNWPESLLISIYLYCEWITVLAVQHYI